MEAYFDNAATTKVNREVCQLMVRAMEEDYGNPSSLHMKGVEGERYIKEAKHIFAQALKVNEKEIYFTSGGTESNNIALIGGAMANMRSGKHIITTGIEHPAVYNPCFYLEEQGFEVTYLPVDDKGCVRLDALKSALRKDTVLVSCMCTNNEIGTIQPLDAIGEIVKNYNPDILFHVDAIQGFGKIRLYPKRLKIDLLSVSGHKFHGPKGVGVLYIRERAKVKPILFGGGQQKDMRPGTENVPGIAGIGRACALIYEDFDAKVRGLYGLREYFVSEVLKIKKTQLNGYPGLLEGQVPGISFFGPAPHVVSVGFEDIRAEVLLHALEEKEIYVSSGSACASNHPAVSGVLKAIGVDKKYLDATVRFSFSYDTTKEEIDYCLSQLNEIVPALRRYTPGGRR